MTKIKRYVKNIEEELDGAKEYIEKALWYKSKGESDRYSKYKQMSMDELGHAMNLHQFAVEDIAILEKSYPEVPEKMLEAWDKAHKEFVEKTAWIKQMQTM